MANELREELQRRDTAKGKHSARKAWLAAHPDRCVGVPGINDDVDDAGSERLSTLRIEMVALGLLGKSTSQVQRETIRRIVSELRGQSVGRGWAGVEQL